MKRPGYLELGRRKVFGKPVNKPLGPIEPPPDPQQSLPFSLGSWHVDPMNAYMQRDDRTVALDRPTLLILLILAEHQLDTLTTDTVEGINRDVLALRVFGGNAPAMHANKLRRSLSFLRRIFSEDGSVRILNAIGDSYVLAIGAPVAGREIPIPAEQPLRPEPQGINAWLARTKRHGLAISAASLIVFIIAGGVYWLIGRGIPLGTVTQITAFASEPGDKRSPSFSPDGKRVVYSWRQASSAEAHLVIRPTAGGSWRPVTLGMGSDEYPAWSPSGRWIAFDRTTSTDCSVFVITPDGTDEHRVGDCNFGAAGPLTWAPDDSSVTLSHRTDSSLSRQLVSVKADTHELGGITNPMIGMQGDEQPVLSASGTRLAFVRSRALGISDLYLLQHGTQSVARLTHDSWPLAGSTWDGAGYSLVFSSPRGGHDSLWRSRLDGHQPELLLGTRVDLRAPSIAPNGRQLVYEEWSRVGQLVITPLDSTTPPTALTNDSMELAREAQLSPDGSQYVYVSNRSGHDELWSLSTLKGGAAQMLTNADLDYIEYPHWSANGNTVVFSGSKAGRFDLWSFQLSDKKLTRLTHDGNSRTPVLSRDGHWLYFSKLQDRDWQLWQQSWPDGKQSKAITTDGGFAPLEAASGATLIYVRLDRRGIWQKATELSSDTSLLADDFLPLDWRNRSVDGNTLYFVSRNDAGMVRLNRLIIDSGERSQLDELPSLYDGSGLTISDDHKNIISTFLTSEHSDLKIAVLE
jgi:Tol biopolymer transport system component